MNYAYFLLAYLISLFCMVSLKAEIIWTLEKLEEIISLEWTIFGISITIFLVWNVLILQFLKSKKPTKENSDSLVNLMDYIRKKTAFHGEATLIFNTVYLLTINLLILIIATSLTLFSTQGVTIFNQTVVCITFYFCTNTICSLFLDILKPLNKEKTSMLKETKVTATELEFQNKVGEITDLTSNIFGAIDKLPTLSDEDKCLIRAKILQETLNQLLTIEDSPNDIEEGSNQP